MSTVGQRMSAWYCDYCHAQGPWYRVKDPTIRAGFAVHMRNCLPSPTTGRTDQ